jgi:hypothetical protein
LEHIVGFLAVTGLLLWGVATKIFSWVPRPAPPTVAASSGIKPNDIIASVILAYNNSQAFFKLGPAWSVPAKGVVIHEINAGEANAISLQIQKSAPQHNLPTSYVLACLAIESVLDPNCENGNFAGSNPTKDPLGYDMGIAQLKLRYITAEGVTFENPEQAKAFAFDVSKAIPYFCLEMAGKIAAAKDVIARNTSSAPDARLNNPLILGTCLYNFGTTGGVENYYQKGVFPSHCTHVIDLWQYFDKALGVKSFPDNLK